MKILIFLFFHLVLISMSLGQHNNDSLLLKKWYFCDTNFYYNETFHLLFKNEKDYCIYPKNYKNGSLEIKNNGEYVLINYSPCGPPTPIENGFSWDGCMATIEGKYRIEKNFIWLDDNKFNIDVIDEKYLLLRREIE